MRVGLRVSPCFSMTTGCGIYALGRAARVRTAGDRRRYRRPLAGTEAQHASSIFALALEGASSATWSHARRTPCSNTSVLSRVQRRYI